MSHITRILLCTSLFTLALPATASVIVLNPYNFSASTQYGINTNQFGSYTDQNGDGSGSSTISGAGQLSPNLAARSSETAGNGGVITADSRATLAYTFEVFGPTGTVQVNIASVGTVNGSSTAPNYGQSYHIIADSKLTIPALGLVDETRIDFSNTAQSCCFPASTQDLGINSGGTPATGFSGSFKDGQLLTLNTNTAYVIGMYVQASSYESGNYPDQANNGLSGTQSATLDPTFALASSVVNPGQYSLAFSPGIGNTASSAPEPATCLLFASGVGLVALFRRASRLA